LRSCRWTPGTPAWHLQTIQECLQVPRRLARSALWLAGARARGRRRGDEHIARCVIAGCDEAGPHLVAPGGRDDRPCRR
jgi:hypothetical protein